MNYDLMDEAKLEAEQILRSLQLYYRFPERHRYYSAPRILTVVATRNFVDGAFSPETRPARSRLLLKKEIRQAA